MDKEEKFNQFWKQCILNDSIVMKTFARQIWNQIIDYLSKEQKPAIWYYRTVDSDGNIHHHCTNGVPPKDTVACFGYYRYPKIEDDDIDAKISGIAGADVLRPKYSEDVELAPELSCYIVHNLGSNDVIVEFYNKFGIKESVEVVIVDTNTVCLVSDRACKGKVVVLG